RIGNTNDQGRIGSSGQARSTGSVNRSAGRVADLIVVDQVSLSVEQGMKRDVVQKPMRDEDQRPLTSKGIANRADKFSIQLLQVFFRRLEQFDIELLEVPLPQIEFRQLKPEQLKIRAQRRFESEVGKHLKAVSRQRECDDPIGHCIEFDQYGIFWNRFLD